jgi:signal transduction histidine kinase/ActR/RegA family two-component response regulator
VAASHQVHGFTAEQIRLLETVSYHVGVALKNARLFARLQQSYTQLDEAQDGLVRSEKLRALGEMASGVAHDFNNVLGAILGRAQLLKHTLGAGEAAAELDIIEKAARDGASTVRRLQDFTRVRRDHDLQPVSTRQIVEDCLSLTRGRWRDEAERVGVQYEVTTDLAAARDVAGEPSELREVMTNLILNALDAMPAGGALHLATRDLPAAGEVHVEVTDDGDGMSDEVRARIFDPFFTTKGVRGVGLGLSVVYGIIERHGGRIEVESVRGQGTTMRVVLPVCGPGLAGRSIAGAGGGRPHGPADVLADAGPALHVLVVDDEPGVRSLLAELLRSAGHSAVEVASGREAMVALAGEGHDNGARFDLVLTDLGMPDMSGWDVARAVGEVPDPPPVVLVTGWGIQLDDELLAASGVRNVIAKPFTIEDVLTVARRATERRAA